MEIKMKTTILFDHPYDGSLNKEILNRVIKNLENSQKEYNLIDFHMEKFDPVYSSEELSLYNTGETTREDIKKYQKYLNESDEIIMIFPIWWNFMPPSTKGFIDLVFKYNYAWKKVDGKLVGMLNHIKQAKIYTTSNRTTDSMVNELGDSISNTLIKATLNDVGISNCVWNNFEQIGYKTKEQIDVLLNKLID